MAIATPRGKRKALKGPEEVIKDLERVSRVAIDIQSQSDY